MNTKFKDWHSKTFGLLLGSLLLYLGYSVLLTEINAAQYEKDFSRVQHPANTMRVDTLSLEVGYYPATYAGDTIHFKSAYLVGALRSYSGEWQTVQEFYNKSLPAGKHPLALLPIEIHNLDRQLLLDVPSDYIVNPADYDILARLREHYDLWGSPKSLNKAGESFYLVYQLWQS